MYKLIQLFLKGQNFFVPRFEVVDYVGTESFFCSFLFFNLIPIYIENRIKIIFNIWFHNLFY